MSAIQMSGVLAMLLSTAFSGAGMVSAAGGAASAVCLPASSFDAGNASGSWRLDAAIGPACLAGPLPAWRAELRMLGIRAGIQHDAAGFAPAFAVDGLPRSLARFLPRPCPGS
jgi:hypothetical protein